MGTLQDAKRKRDRSEEDSEIANDSVDDTVDYGGEGFEALGYSTAHLFAGLSTRDEVCRLLIKDYLALIIY